MFSENGFSDVEFNPASTELCYCIVSGINNESVLVVALRHVSSGSISVSWERGEEILPGALL